jgi:molybdenum storage protein
MWGQLFTVMNEPNQPQPEETRHTHEAIVEVAGARHVASRLMRESLVDKQVIAGTEAPQIRILPWANVIKIGGRSIIDRGRTALYPLIDEIAANLDRHKMIIGTGAGIRSRHVFSVALDLGLPPGALAVLSAIDTEMNAHIVGALLAKYGVGILLPAANVNQLLPVLLQMGNAVVFNGVPPYHLWEQPADLGKLPPHRTDSGTLLMADVLGARSLIYVKDQDGLYSEDPAVNPGAEFIPHIGLTELERRNLKTLPIERQALRLLHTARSLTQIQLVNGLKPGQLTAALDGKPVGTIIAKEAT